MEVDSQGRRSFRVSKSKLLNSNFLAHYSLSLPVKLSCDASSYGIGACLTHVYEDGSERRVALLRGHCLQLRKAMLK